MVIVWYILAEVSGKCPGFYKCLRFSKFGFATFSNSAGCQKSPAISESKKTEHENVGDNNIVYLNITPYFYPFLHFIIRLYGSSL